VSVPPSEIHGVFMSHIFASLLTLTTRRRIANQGYEGLAIVLEVLSA
jgi:hypothetical protein